MKIVIKKDAGRLYRAGFIGQVVPNFKWAKTLDAIEGKEIEVETEYLFKDQYNTVPIPGVSEQGLRIMQESVEKVIDDERVGKARCQWCGKTVPFEMKQKDDTGEMVSYCEHCNEYGYLEKLW